MKNIQISVIIPTYKPQDYLWECLDSLLTQILSKDLFEIIIILNGCSEPYKSNILTYIRTKGNTYSIKLIHTSIVGVSNARNEGIEAANGKYVTFVDDDDVVSQSYLKEMYDLAEEGYMPFSYLITFRETIDVTRKDYISECFIRNNQKKKCSLINVRSYLSIPVCKLIDKSIIREHRFNNKYKNGEDGLFMLEISDMIMQISFTSSQAIYYRRIRDGSAVNNKRDIFLNMKIIGEYVKIYLKAPLKYNLLFVLSRIVAEVVDMFYVVTKIKCHV